MCFQLKPSSDPIMVSLGLTVLLEIYLFLAAFVFKDMNVFESFLPHCFLRAMGHFTHEHSRGCSDILCDGEGLGNKIKEIY